MTDAAAPASLPLAPRSRALAAGTVLDGYVVDRLVARGGFGEVYRAVDAASGRPVALKVMHAELCATPSAVARFLREAEVMVRIRHPNVVELRSTGTVDDGRPYLAMEWLAGTDLGRVVAEQGRLAPARALAVLEPVAAALTAAHAGSIIHRDVKASNVLLADAGGSERVVLLDFGVAKLAAPDVLELTTSRQIIGTPLTMAPEQIAGAPVDVRTDVYGLGVLAYHLLTGRLPFEDESPTVVQYLHAHARRPRVSALAPVAPRVDEVLARAMAIDPGQRFADPLAFVAALRAAFAAAATDAADGAPAAEPALEPRPAVGVLVEVRAAADALEDPDDALVADLADVLALAEESLAAAGLAPVIQGGNLVLHGRAVAPPEELTAARAAAVALARRLADQLAARPGGDPRVGFVVVAHAATALCAGEQLRGGELADLADWLPDPEVRGAVATRAALDGLPILGAAVSDSRVRRV
ncbi:MAG TPA: serine/threonine-protein kinase [Kofleriaceae bacterium]|nr:serine/threonine-protein kinase [Kofleriaceae bacterium]